MSLSSELKAAYELVLKDLEAKRASVHTDVIALQKKLRELDQSIATHYRELGNPVPIKVARATVSVPHEQRYAFISVHWAILHLLSEAVAPMPTAEIAAALKNAGVRTKAANFVNNVSAVLSTNMRPKGEEEVELTDGGWKLTSIGRDKISHIVTSPNFLRRCPWAVPMDATDAR